MSEETQPPKPGSTAGSGSSVTKQGPSTKGGSGIPALSGALGNLILLTILICLISIPFLVYFTDTGARVRREVEKTVQAMDGPPVSSVDAVALKEAQGRVLELENQVAALQAMQSLQEIPAEPPVNVAVTGNAVAPAPDLAPVPPTLPRKEYDVSRLFNGVGVETVLNLRQGDTATRERVDPDAYKFQIQLELNVPKPTTSLAELAALNPHLPSILPALEPMLESAEVSPLFGQLYGLKHERIKSYLTQLDRLETRHNYFDTETVLELKHPESGRKALLVQGEMDVVADGSDGDRLPTIDDYISLSTYYQPTTSYGWPKQTAAPNPLVGRLEKELAEVLEEYAIKGLSPERNEYLQNRRDELRRLIADLKVRSYLVAEADPFVVLPLSFVRERGDFVPQIGDYAVVIYGTDVYPAICGDAGPSWKFGEASLFVAKTINESAGPYNRPVSDLKVTYLLFPGTKPERNEPPDLAKWTEKCGALLGELGGLGEGFKLHAWRDIIAERAAVREGNALRGAVARHAADAAGAAADATRALDAARKAAAAARGKLEAAQAAGTTDTATLLRAVETAEARVSAVASAAGEADAARDRIDAMAEEVEKAAKVIVEASGKGYATPRDETTEVALAALAQARTVVAAAEKEAKAALAAARRAA